MKNAYEGQRKGTLQVFRSGKQLDFNSTDMKLLKEYCRALFDVDVSIIEQAQTLEWRWWPVFYHSETGDCHRFTRLYGEKPATQLLQVPCLILKW
ncbi:hypothetical protein O9929_11340 [Vibrio lentus]|nr:hypothetical protein [Vibrio lentus]